MKQTSSPMRPLFLALATCVLLACSSATNTETATDFDASAAPAQPSVGSGPAPGVPSTTVSEQLQQLPSAALAVNTTVGMLGDALAANLTPAATLASASEAGEPSALGSNLLFLPEENSARTVIDLCWQPSAFAAGELSALYAEGRAQTQAAIEDSWVSHSRVRVRWADNCDQGGVPVEVEDRRSSADRRGMVLNFTFGNYITVCAPTAGRDVNVSWTYCVRSLAVHEFGHVLGFDHEQNKSPDGITCADGTPRPHDVGNFLITGNLPPTPIDSSSVMSYCSEGFRDTLSSGDIEALSALYGATERHVESGKSYALRRGPQFAHAVANDTADGNSVTLLGYSNLIEDSFAVERVAGEGSLSYDDQIRITRGSDQLCALPEPNADGSIAIAFISPALERSACVWTLERSADVVGDGIIDVNDPVTLALDLTLDLTLATLGVDPAQLPQRVSVATRFLGPF